MWKHFKFLSIFLSLFIGISCFATTNRKRIITFIPGFQEPWSGAHFLYPPDSLEPVDLPFPDFMKFKIPYKYLTEEQKYISNVYVSLVKNFNTLLFALNGTMEDPRLIYSADHLATSIAEYAINLNSTVDPLIMAFQLKIYSKIFNYSLSLEKSRIIAAQGLRKIIDEKNNFPNFPIFKLINQFFDLDWVSYNDPKRDQLIHVILAQIGNRIFVDKLPVDSELITFLTKLGEKVTSDDSRGYVFSELVQLIKGTSDNKLQIEILDVLINLSVSKNILDFGIFNIVHVLKGLPSLLNSEIQVRKIFLLSKGLGYEYQNINNVAYEALLKISKEDLSENAQLAIMKYARVLNSKDKKMLNNLISLVSDMSYANKNVQRIANEYPNSSVDIIDIIDIDVLNKSKAFREAHSLSCKSVL